MKTHYIVQTATSRTRGNYRRVAVLEVEEGIERVAMISKRAHGVVRIVETWEKCFVGTTERCAYQKAYAEAWSVCDQLNAEAA